MLLENPKNIPTKFRKFNSVFNSVHELSKINKISKISLALSFLKNKLYKKVIFGVASQSQLKKILKNSQIMQINLPNFKFKDKNILTNPSLW